MSHTVGMGTATWTTVDFVNRLVLDTVAEMRNLLFRSGGTGQDRDKDRILGILGILGKRESTVFPQLLLLLFHRREIPS